MDVEVGDTDCVPLVNFVSLQAFDAVQDVAFVELQVRVAEFPDVIVLGFAKIETVGRAFEATTAIVALSFKASPAYVVSLVYTWDAPCLSILSYKVIL